MYPGQTQGQAGSSRSSIPQSQSEVRPDEPVDHHHDRKLEDHHGGQGFDPDLYMAQLRGSMHPAGMSLGNEVYRPMKQPGQAFGGEQGYYPQGYEDHQRYIPPYDGQGYPQAGGSSGNGHLSQQQQPPPPRPFTHPPYHPSHRPRPEGPAHASFSAPSRSDRSNTQHARTSDLAPLQFGRRFWYDGKMLLGPRPGSGPGSGLGSGSGSGSGAAAGSGSESASRERSETGGRSVHDLEDGAGVRSRGPETSDGGGGGGEDADMGMGERGEMTGSSESDKRGMVLRFAIEIVQQPLHSRAFNDGRDRRPLVHPPIIRLRVLRSEPKEGMGGLLALVKDLEDLMDDDALWDDKHDELDADVLSLDMSGLVCTLDLISYRDMTQAPTNDVTMPTSGPHQLANRIPVSWAATANNANARRAAAARASREQQPSTSRSEDGDGRAGLSGRDSTVTPPNAFETATTIGRRRGSSASLMAANNNKKRRLTSGQRESSSADGIPAARSSPVNTDDANGPSGLPREDGEASASSCAIEEEETQRNLYGNVHIGGRRMFGLPSAGEYGSQGSSEKNDLGIWFIFTDVSIRTQGEYAIRFRCSDLNRAQSSPSPPARYFANLLPHDANIARDLTTLGIGYAQPGHDPRGALMCDDSMLEGSQPDGNGNAQGMAREVDGGWRDGNTQIAARTPGNAPIESGISDQGDGSGLGHGAPLSGTAFGSGDHIEDGAQGMIHDPTVRDEGPIHQDHVDTFRTPPASRTKPLRAPILTETFSRSFKVFYGRSCPPVPSQTRLTEHFTR